MSTRIRANPIVNLWGSNYGEIRLPADFPTYIFRNDGWWDRRFTATREKWESWIAVEEAMLRMGYSIPNRLYGAAINAEGDAI